MDHETCLMRSNPRPAQRQRSWSPTSNDISPSPAALIVNHQHRLDPTQRSTEVHQRKELVDALPFPVLTTGWLFAWWRAQDWSAELGAELDKPGGYHRRRGNGVAERLMDQRLGTAQENALDACGELYGVTSNVVHGSASQQAAARYKQVVRLAWKVFVPLPGRAKQILEPAERQEPTPGASGLRKEWFRACL